jgi:hypothetical protein
MCERRQRPIMARSLLTSTSGWLVMGRSRRPNVRPATHVNDGLRPRAAEENDVDASPDVENFHYLWHERRDFSRYRAGAVLRLPLLVKKPFALNEPYFTFRGARDKN